MTSWILRRVSSETGRLPLRAYDTVLRETPARRAISPMFTATPCSNRFAPSEEEAPAGREGRGWNEERRPAVEPVRVK
jgi:hypothetical protein